MYLLEEAILEFLHHCRYEKNLSPKTLQFYHIDLLQLQKFLQREKHSTEIKAITKVELRGYLEHLSSLKPKSVKRKVATLKAMFNYLEFEDRIEVNPLRKMRIKIKEPFQLPKALNLQEMGAIFKTAYLKLQNKRESDYAYFEALRNVVVIELLFATGARVSEIAGLKTDHINLDTGVVTIKGKGNKERIIQICNTHTFEVLRNYQKQFAKLIQDAKGAFLVNRLGKALTDQSIRNMIRKLAQEAKVNKHVTPHMFRHSFATLLLEKEVDIKYIQAMLGHSSIVTTQIYTHVNREKQRQILQAKHPRMDFAVAGT